MKLTLIKYKLGGFALANGREIFGDDFHTSITNNDAEEKALAKVLGWMRGSAHDWLSERENQEFKVDSLEILADGLVNLCVEELSSFVDYDMSHRYGEEWGLTMKALREKILAILAKK